MSDPIVQVAHGKLKGKVRKTAKNREFYSFKGIPYAKPPVGELRFSVPVPPENWQGIRDATKDCSASPQYEPHTSKYIGNEDCLVLNVYTPSLPTAGAEPLPVMVYIHGGGFVYGHGTDDCNNGPEFLMEKDVVLVAINYRLGILGFLSLNCKEAPGNMGLRDQVQALKWVQQNIAKFNGDPNNVTIFGLSAGGASVEYLMLSSSARGLFHKAIAQCGSTLCQSIQSSMCKVKQLAYKTAALNGKEFQDDKALLQYLKSLETKELTILSMKALATEKFKGGIHFGFVPVIETPIDWEPFLDRKTYELLKSGEFAKVPLMAGFATREGLVMLGMAPDVVEKVVKSNCFVQTLPFVIDSGAEAAIEQKLHAVYKQAESTGKEDDAFAIDYFTDVQILGGVYTATSLIVKNNDKPVYFYEFSYDGNFNDVKKKMKINREGACHGDELGYLLKILMLNEPPTLKDVVIRERMVTMWTNFAKYGNPTPVVDNLIPVKWEPTTEKKMNCFVINDTLSVKHEVYPERVKLFQELYEKFELI
ncbi:carboxylesterase family domain-containing protein [Phthorimaea operculella]|nr:carboxylesterase family domain-containing protein [Phthorimaea operculella]